MAESEDLSLLQDSSLLTEESFKEKLSTSLALNLLSLRKIRRMD